MAAGKELLTDALIRSKLKESRSTGEPVTVKDGGGVTLIARPDGSGWWRLRYWLDGRENRLSLGVYPAVGLRAARRKADAAREKIAAGADPSEERKEAKAAQAAQREAKELAAAGLPGPGTFEHAAREWLAAVHQHRVSAGHADRTRIRFEQDAFPWIGARPLDEIEAPELLTVLRRVESRGAVETAHRLKDSCGQVFRYGIAAGICARNPAADLRDALRPVPSRHYAAVTDPAAVGDLLRAMADYRGHPYTRAALALSALLFLRPGEVRQMRWEWIDFDGALLTIPGAMMKRRMTEKLNGPPHLVPLAPQALAVLREVHPLTGASGQGFVFPSLQTRDRPMSENTVNVALRRMGYDRQTMSAHGFRAMARTLAAERLGVDPSVIEAQLAHAVPDALGRAYNRTQFLDQRRELMTRWADYLDRLRDGAQVVPLRGHAA
jgi:integrase